MKTNYVLIDYENIQPTVLSQLDHEHTRVLVFVGANQPKLGFELVAALQPLGERVQYIKLASNGANALDFHIAFYIGQLAAQEPDAYFHIISRDAGFDPLLQHLKCRNMRAFRWADAGELPFNTASKPTTTSTIPVKEPLPKVQHEQVAPRPPASQPKPIAVSATNAKKNALPSTLKGRVAYVKAKLQGPRVPRPTTVTKLSNHINSMFQKQLAENDIKAVIAALQKQGFLKFADDGNITYPAV